MHFTIYSKKRFKILFKNPAVPQYVKNLSQIYGFIYEYFLETKLHN